MGLRARMRHLRPRPFRNPALAALAVVAMAVGIGSFSSSVVTARALLPDLPVEKKDQVVKVGWSVPHRPGRISGLAPSQIRAVQEGVPGLAEVGGFRTLRAHLTGEAGPPARLRAAEMTAGAFRTLRVEPVLGRWLQPEDEAPEAERVAVLSHGIWQARFGGDRGVIGTRIRVNDQSHTVVGVMPPDFAFPAQQELWLPLRPSLAGADASAEILGRLQDGVTLESVQAQLDGLASGQREAGLDGPDDGRLTARRWVAMLRENDSTAQALPALVVLMTLVLLVACANVALLFLVQALRSERATAMRLTLGAPRGTVILERLLETLVLAALGGLLGLALTFAWTKVFQRVAAGLFEYWVDFSLDWTVLSLTVLAVVGAALMAGVVPALRGTDLDLAATLREGSQGSSVRLGRAARILLVAEVAFSAVVLVSSGHALRGLRNTLGTVTELPVPMEEVLVARYELLDGRHPDPGARLELHRRVVDRLDAHPAVRAAAVVDALPGALPNFGPWLADFEVEGVEHDADRLPRTRVAAVSPSFFSFLEMEPVRGRALTWEDRPERGRVAVVNESFARRHLQPNQIPGARIAIAPDRWRTVVGVVPDMGTERPDGRADGVYIPLPANRRTPWLMLHARGDPRTLIPVVREAVWEEDPRIPIYDAGAMEDVVMRAAGPARLLIGTMAIFALAALLLTVVGLHGLLAFSLRRRTREVAVCAALGAPARFLGWRMLRGTAGRVAMGLLLGIPLAWWFSPYLGEGLLGADPRDPTLYLAVSALIALGAVVASLGPLTRALRMSIMEALRVE